MDTTRKQIRLALTTILRQNLDGVPSANVYSSRLANPKGRSPLIYVTSAGSSRPPLTVRTKKAELFISIFSLVLLSDPDNTLWTEEQAEGMLDDIEGQIPDILLAHKTNAGLWNQVEYREYTSVERVPLGGHDYLVEEIPLIFTKG